MVLFCFVLVVGGLSLIIDYLKYSQFQNSRSILLSLSTKTVQYILYPQQLRRQIVLITSLYVFQAMDLDYKFLLASVAKQWKNFQIINSDVRIAKETLTFS